MGGEVVEAGFVVEVVSAVGCVVFDMPEAKTVVIGLLTFVAVTASVVCVNVVRAMPLTFCVCSGSVPSFATDGSEPDSRVVSAFDRVLRSD